MEFSAQGNIPFKLFDYNETEGSGQKTSNTYTIHSTNKWLIDTRQLSKYYYYFYCFMYL